MMFAEASLLSALREQWVRKDARLRKTGEHGRRLTKR
jgi:hypothetical protein